MIHKQQRVTLTCMLILTTLGTVGGAAERGEDGVFSSFTSIGQRTTRPSRQQPGHDVWLSVVPPDSTLRPYLVLNAFNEFPIRIHNENGKSARGEIRLTLRARKATIADGRLPFNVGPRSTETVFWQTSLSAHRELAGELATLSIRGAASGKKMESMEVPVRLSRGRTVEFLANSFTEMQYVREAGKSGCAESIRFGGEFSYLFDLRDVSWAQLKLNVGANEAHEWHVSLSKNEKTWEEVARGHNWPSWLTVDLSKYLPQTDESARTSLFVKVHGNDCQLRELLLETEQPLRPRAVQVFQRTPTELLVWDTRPELGMGMHGMPDDQIALVRKLGIRFVRHTMYWYGIEKTRDPGKYDADQLAEWDALVRGCDRQGVILLVVVHGNPPGVSFANRQEGYQRFARFMGDMVRRYPQIRYWELWNEMDAGFTDLFGAGHNDVPMRERGRMYAEMLKVVTPRIREANPKALVLVGGMSDSEDFPRGIYHGGGRDYFDIMNLHTYGVPVMWSFSARGQSVRNIMDEHGDADKPLWNTEFGIDAGNFVGAWGYPHSWKPPQKDDEFFDEQQQREWEACLSKSQDLGLYAKMLPYQFFAGNERDDDKHIRESAQLPPGMTIDDYGFGILRRDGKTPRPTYNWLLEQRINLAVEQQPVRKIDIRCRPRTKAAPVGYKSRWEGDELVIKDVMVDSAYPTLIKLKEVKSR